MQADRGGEKPMAMYLISRLDEGWSVLHYITLRTTLLVQMLILMYSRLLYPSYTTAACYSRYLYQALKYRSVTDIVRPIREIVRPTEETTGHSVRPK
jgi:hypothetical protein